MKPKIKHSTLCNNYQDGGLKNVNIESKIISLQCSWIKRLYDKNMHNWKIIPLALIEKFLGKCFKSHSNMKIENKYIRNFPKYYQKIIIPWSRNFSSVVDLPSAILSQYLWFNSKILIDNKSVMIVCFSDNNINFVKHAFTSSGKLRNWENFKEIAILDHHLIKKNQISALEKLHSKELYIMQIVEGYKKPTSQIYFENVFQKYDFQWNIIYLLPRLVTIDSVMRAFQYKILHNVLFLNKQLFLFNKVTSPLCSICNKEDEIPTHLFFTCSFTTSLWKQLQNALLNILVLPNLTPQSAFLNF